jgi:hypothetical protein
MSMARGSAQHTELHMLRRAVPIRPSSRRSSSVSYALSSGSSAPLRLLCSYPHAAGHIYRPSNGISAGAQVPDSRQR